MKLWLVAHFFLLTFGIEEHTKHCSMSFLYSSTRNDMLQCFVCSPIPKVSEKKWATGQSFIRKEITSYRIGTLGTLITADYTYLQILSSLLKAALYVICPKTSCPFTFPWQNSYCLGSFMLIKPQNRPHN